MAPERRQVVREGSRWRLIEEDQRDFVDRIRLMLHQGRARLALTDQEAIARMRRDCDKKLDDLVKEFSTGRTDNMQGFYRP
jgi:hypothetical protein